MYKVVRYVDGSAETLKDSNNHFDVTFSDINSAELETKKLNMDLILMNDDVWGIETI
ncbi:hypothetical protein [Shouchella patagoniensis]|uniref:hypothetical protein n=1 Tax=Shouchella patagoniensis TaxID=228576 RepID=UPI001472B429|nr:hypothetical protein [Shouchella patagoniensis]